MIPEPKKIELLGSAVHPLTKESLLSLIRESASAKDKKTIIGCHNALSVYLFHKTKDNRFPLFFNRVADYIFIDGMSIVMAGRLLGLPINRNNRLTALDYMDDIFQLLCDQNLKLFYLGSLPGIAERAAYEIKKKFPAIPIQTHHGHFPKEQHSPENRQILKQINDFAPDVLMVGMGMPLQEVWITDNHREIDARVIMSIGGAFDYLAGIKATPPRWLGRWGLEWLFRLVSEPSRLWKRYLIYSPYIFWLVFKELFSHRLLGKKKG